MPKEIQRNLLFYQRFQDKMHKDVWIVLRIFAVLPIGLAAALLGVDSPSVQM